MIVTHAQWLFGKEYLKDTYPFLALFISFIGFYSEKFLKLGLSDNAGLATFACVTRNPRIRST